VSGPASDPLGLVAVWLPGQELGRTNVGSLGATMSAADAKPTIDELAADMIERGVRSVHTLAWRDLDDDDAGGSEVHADEFMRRWAAAGLDVTHRTSFALGRPTTAERNGYHVVRRGNRYTVFPRAIAAEITRRMGPYDALVEIWNGVPWFSPVWCRKPRITFLHHVHGPMWGQILPGPLAGFGRVLEARLAPPFYRRTQMVTPSDATRDELLELGFRPELVLAVPNGVSDAFHPGGQRSREPHVVAVGRLAPVKRFDGLIRAAIQARRRVPTLRLDIVGSGPQRDELEALVRSEGATDWITFIGQLSHHDLVALYQRAWLVASASLAEGWGLTLTEAAACGTPAVATDIRGHRSSVVAGVTGVLSPLEELGTTLADVLLDDARRAALGAAALQRAATLTWDAAARDILAALHARVVEGRPRRSPVRQ
jgi:glycosyltransferase involved in cell wall biosynthesis